MYKNIIIPVEVFSDNLHENDLHKAQFLANVSSGHIHLLAIIPEFAFARTKWHFDDAKRLMTVLEALAKQRLLKLAKRLALPDGFIHLHTYIGNIDEGILSLSRKEETLVIVGENHYQTGDESLTLSTERIVKENNIPVMFV